LEDLGVDGEVILNWTVLKRWFEEINGFNWHRNYTKVTMKLKEIPRDREFTEVFKTDHRMSW
jgi:hypothetical protein